MKIIDILNRKKLAVSFEFFPPKTEQGEKELFENILNLKKLSPDYVSVTYGAGGSTRSKTNDIAVKISKEDINVMIHTTSIMHTKNQMKEMIRTYKDEGIDNLLALRGDSPQGMNLDYSKQEMVHAVDLINLIKSEFGSHFSIGGAAFPEGHLESKDKEKEMEYFKLKQDAGMEFAITQLFFDNSYYYDFLDRTEKKGVNIPIIPGIMPITNYQQIEKFIAMCGATVPKELIEKLERVKENREESEKIGIEYAVKQCEDLMKNGVKGLHFYTLNKSKATIKIYENLK